MRPGAIMRPSWDMKFIMYTHMVYTMETTSVKILKYIISKYSYKSTVDILSSILYIYVLTKEKLKKDRIFYFAQRDENECLYISWRFEYIADLWWIYLCSKWFIYQHWLKVMWTLKYYYIIKKLYILYIYI